MQNINQKLYSRYFAGKKKYPYKPRDMFVSYYILISKQPFRNPSATQDYLDLAYPERLFCFSLECIYPSEEEKASHWIFSFRLSPLEFYEKIGRALGENNS